MSDFVRATRVIAGAGASLTLRPSHRLACAAGSCDATTALLAPRVRVASAVVGSTGLPEWRRSHRSLATRFNGPLLGDDLTSPRYVGRQLHFARLQLAAGKQHHRRRRALGHVVGRHVGQVQRDVIYPSSFVIRWATPGQSSRHTPCAVALRANGPFGDKLRHKKAIGGRCPPYEAFHANDRFGDKRPLVGGAHPTSQPCLRCGLVSIHTPCRIYQPRDDRICGRRKV